MKKNRKWLSWFVTILELIVSSFFTIFFVIYIGKFGLSNLILEGDGRWNILFNIGVWYVLVTFSINSFFDCLENILTLLENKEERK